MSETVSVFKDIAQLNPLFRDQITKFSINQVAANVYDDRTNLPILQPLYPPAKFKNYKMFSNLLLSTTDSAKLLS
jgi:hypothetical protein